MLCYFIAFHITDLQSAYLTMSRRNNKKFSDNVLSLVRMLKAIASAYRSAHCSGLMPLFDQLQGAYITNTKASVQMHHMFPSISEMDVVSSRWDLH